MNWQPFVYQNLVYDLSHLNSRTATYEQPAKGDKPVRQYQVEVIFSLHCFTRGFQENEQPERDLLYSDSRETRVFDFRRYELSKQLPRIMQELADRKCYHSGKGNFFTVEVFDEQEEKIEYDIFFEASKSEKRGTIRLFVQSAYVRDAKHRSRPALNRIGFYVILFNTINNKPIKIQK